MRLDEGTDSMLAQLINKPRTTIDAVAVAEPLTWSQVRAIIAAAKSAKP
jgi:hypothetical protein